MQDPPADIDYRKIVLLNDDRTPFGFVTTTLSRVFAMPREEAARVATEIHRAGRAELGPFPPRVAAELAGEARRLAEGKGYPLEIAVTRSAGDKPRRHAECGFCGKTSEEVTYLYAGQGAFICDGCILAGADALSGGVAGRQFAKAHQLIDWHFGATRKEAIVSVSRDFPLRVRADLQVAVDRLFNEPSVKFVGVRKTHDYETLGLSALMETGRNAKDVGPLEYEDVDIGEETPRRCLKNALWLRKQDALPYAVVLAKNSIHGQESIRLEIAAPRGEQGETLTRTHFDEIEGTINAAPSYRGKILSLEQVHAYSGMASGIAVHQLPAVARDAIVLPAETLDLIEANIVGFATIREALRALGQATKKGLLFHGPPGNGKTHTVRYLAGRLSDHTTLIITAEQLGLLSEYFTLARLLQPALLVIEDADLIGRSREDMTHAWEEATLNKLLNEMDGLRQDADIFVILTTNRPDNLEPALAARPGRIDQSIEFPLPDDAGRAKLVALYGAGLKVEAELVASIVKRSEGVSAAFIKELMRRAAQASIDDDAMGHISAAHIDAALDEMLFRGGALNTALLGGVSDSASPPG
jgi:ATP-dependent Clp protease adapter protein ClpS